MFKYHIFALLLGTILDYVFGNIYCIWNPFDTIKDWVKFLDRALLGDEIILLEKSKQRSLGAWLIILVVFPVFVGTLFFAMLTYEIHPWFGVLFEALASYFCLNFNRLYYGGLGVAADYYGNGTAAMKHTASLLIGRQVEVDTEDAITSETITYIANEASDSVLSPLFVMFLFGPVGGFIFRTLDIIEGQIGTFETGTYNSRYDYFGQPIAKLNSVVDYLPSRFSGALVVFAARHTFGGFNGKNARFIHLRDRKKAISAFAGALDIGLHNGLIGDFDKPIEVSDINKAVNLLRNSFMLCQAIFVILLLFF